MTQYLSRQIADMEDELAGTQAALRDAEDALGTARDRIDDLEYDCEEMGKFIEYIDKTNPELRIAFEAAEKLKGESR
jgi:chromosome segregation ATPase